MGNLIVEHTDQTDFYDQLAKWGYGFCALSAPSNSKDRESCRMDRLASFRQRYNRKETGSSAPSASDSLALSYLLEERERRRRSCGTARGIASASLAAGPSRVSSL